jgi:hypothetical protein
MQRTIGGQRVRRGPRWRTRIAVAAFLALGASGTDSCCNGDEPSTNVATESPTTATFLGPGDFEGDFEGQPSPVEFGGEAKYLGRVLFLNLARDTVDDVLPGELELAPNTSTTLPEHHPVILLFGHQTQTALVYPFWTPEIGSDYRELILMIPFVRKTGGQYWHNYVVRMYLEDFWATLLGNQHYGLQKIRANFSETATTFEVILESISMFTSKATDNGSWTSDAEAETGLTNYTQMKKIIGMPVLGRLNEVLGKPFICSYFEWNTQDAEVRSILGTARFVEPFVTGMLSWQELGEIASVSEGAWELRGLRWRIGYPPSVCKF